MASPFPGMDPFLEGSLWPDVHHNLASIIQEIIAPQIAPKYVAKVEPYVVEDTAPHHDVGIMYPDVAVLKRKQSKVSEPMTPYGGNAALSPPTVTISSIQAIEVRVPVLKIYDREKNQLITAIEILSPVNKREPGLEMYRQKRKQLFEAGVHFLEIDLLRRGERPFAHPLMPKAHYIVSLIRAGIYKTEIWAFGIKELLPVVPVPLVSPDKDIKLDLGKALETIYQRNLYDLSIDYIKLPPPPSFEKAELEWMKGILKE